MIGALTLALASSLLSTETLVPDLEQLVYGANNNGGNLASWAVEDGNVRNICELFRPTINHPIIRVNLRFTSTILNPAGILFRLKTGTHSPGILNITIQLRDQQNPTVWVDTDVIERRFVNGTFYEAQAQGDLSRYVNAQGQMWGRVEIWNRGPNLKFFPCTSFDLANLIVSD